MVSILKWATGGGWYVLVVAAIAAAIVAMYVDYQSLRTDKARLEGTVAQLQTTIRDQQVLREQLASLSTINDTITAQLQRHAAQQADSLAAGLKSVRMGISKDVQTKNLCVVPQSVLASIDWMHNAARDRADHATGDAPTPAIPAHRTVDPSTASTTR